MLFYVKQVTKRTTRTARLTEESKVLGSIFGGTIGIGIVKYPGKVGNGGLI